MQLFDWNTSCRPPFPRPSKRVCRSGYLCCTVCALQSMYLDYVLSSWLLFLASHYPRGYQFSCLLSSAGASGCTFSQLRQGSSMTAHPTVTQQPGIRIPGTLPSLRENSASSYKVHGLASKEWQSFKQIYKS
jgi:hypothetical protein